MAYVPFPSAGQQQQQQPRYPTQQSAYPPARQYSTVPYQQQQPSGSPHVQPGTVAYTATQAPNGGVVYQPVVAQEVSYNTPQGIVKSIQYVPAGNTVGGGQQQPQQQPQQPPIRAGSVPIYAQPQQQQQQHHHQYTVAPQPQSTPYPHRTNSVPIPSGQVPGIAYDTRNYGDAFGGGHGGPDPKFWSKEQKRAEKEREKTEKENRKLQAKAAKKQQQWAKGGREREKAEEDELRRARDRDRKADEYDGQQQQSVRGRKANSVYGVSGFDRERSRDPYARENREARDIRERSRDPYARDPRERSMERNFSGVSIGDRERKMSISQGGKYASRNVSSSSLHGPGAAYNAPITYGGAPAYGGIGGGGAQSAYGGANPSAYGGGGYDRDRKVSASSAIERIRKVSQGAYDRPHGGGGYGGLSGGMQPAPGGGIMPAPLGGPMINPVYPNTRSYENSARVPISALPPSPGRPEGGIVSQITGGAYPRSRRGSMYGGGSGYGSGNSPYNQPHGIAPIESSQMGVYPGAHSNHSYAAQRQSFNREQSRAVAYTPFETFAIVQHMNELLQILPQIPPLPAVLVPHDVLHEDWATCMSDIVESWQGPGSKGGARGRAETVRRLIDQWNNSFFIPRSVEIIFTKNAKGGGRFHDEDFSSDSDTESSVSDDEEDPRFGGGYQHSRRPHQGHKVGRSRGSPDRSYSIFCTYIPPGRKAGPVGYPGVGFP